MKPRQSIKTIKSNHHDCLSCLVSLLVKDYDNGATFSSMTEDREHFFF